MTSLIMMMMMMIANKRPSWCSWIPPARVLRNQFRFERNNFALNKIILLWQEREGELAEGNN